MKIDRYVLSQLFNHLSDVVGTSLSTWKKDKTQLTNNLFTLKLLDVNGKKLKTTIRMVVGQDRIQFFDKLTDSVYEWDHKELDMNVLNNPRVVNKETAIALKIGFGWVRLYYKQIGLERYITDLRTGGVKRPFENDGLHYSLTKLGDHQEHVVFKYINHEIIFEKKGEPHCKLNGETETPESTLFEIIQPMVTHIGRILEICTTYKTQ